MANFHWLRLFYPRHNCDRIWCTWRKLSWDFVLELVYLVLLCLPARVQLLRRPPHPSPHCLITIATWHLLNYLSSTVLDLSFDFFFNFWLCLSLSLSSRTRVLERDRLTLMFRRCHTPKQQIGFLSRGHLGVFVSNSAHRQAIQSELIEFETLHMWSKFIIVRTLLRNGIRPGMAKDTSK